jgi:hypothetical protein
VVLAEAGGFCEDRRAARAPSPDFGGTRVARVRLVIARCQVDYVGRLTAHLPMAPRLLLVKADGSVSIHADDRAYKPLNWMSPPCWLEERPGVWTVRNKADESLVITIDEVLHDSKHELGVDPGLVKDGVEAHLQELLAAHPGVLGEGYTLVRREYMTAIGPVDLLCRDADGRSVAVEIKRRGEIDGVEQLTRYLERRWPGCSPHSRSSRRRARWPRTAASVASPSTTTRCAVWRPPTCACSEAVSRLRGRGVACAGHISGIGNRTNNAFRKYRTYQFRRYEVDASTGLRYRG